MRAEDFERLYADEAPRLFSFLASRTRRPARWPRTCWPTRSSAPCAAVSATSPPRGGAEPWHTILDRAEPAARPRPADRRRGPRARARGRLGRRRLGSARGARGPLSARWGSWRGGARGGRAALRRRAQRAGDRKGARRAADDRGGARLPRTAQAPPRTSRRGTPRGVGRDLGEARFYPAGPWASGRASVKLRSTRSVAGSRYWGLRSLHELGPRGGSPRRVEPQREQRGPAGGWGRRAAGSGKSGGLDARSWRSSRISGLDLQCGAQVADAVDLGGDERDLRDHDEDPDELGAPDTRGGPAPGPARRRRRRRRIAPGAAAGGTGSTRGSAGRRRPGRRTRQDATSPAATSRRTRSRRNATESAKPVTAPTSTGSHMISPSRRGAVMSTFCRPVTRPSSCAPSRVSVSDQRRIAGDDRVGGEPDDRRGGRGAARGAGRLPV